MAPWLAVNDADLHWEVQADWRDRLFDGQGLRFAEWQRNGWVEILKEAAHRNLYRIHLPDRTLYLKHYPLPDLRARVRRLFRGPKARGEFERARQLEARNVPTIEPVAFGQSPGGASFLLTLGLEQAVPLSSLIERILPQWPASRRRDLRFRLGVALARFLAFLHDAGVRHQDLHPGNLLVRLDEQDEPQLYLIDLHEVQLGGPLSPRDSLANLLLLNRWAVQRTGRIDRRRFWQRYVRERRGWDLDAREEHRLAGSLERRTWASCLRFWEKRDRRYRTVNRYFVRLRQGPHRGWAVRDVPEAALAGWLDQPEAPFQTGVVKSLKDSPSSHVIEAELKSGEATRPVVLKRFAVTCWHDPLVSLVRTPPAQRSWLNGHRLLGCGIPTARPLAVLGRQRLGLMREGYLMTERLAGACDLLQYVAHLGALPPSERRGRLNQLIEQVARLIRDLHQRRFSHRDLKAANVLVAARSDNVDIQRYEVAPGQQLFLIDLVGLERCRWLSRRRRLRNLARLHTSFCEHPAVRRTDKLRFLRVYLRWGLQGKQDWKEWWRGIARATQAKIDRNQRHGRPVS
jgi:tRNA A-37 threonylcarbamoyl transferase component Bud32